MLGTFYLSATYLRARFDVQSKTSTAEWYIISLGKVSKPEYCSDVRVFASVNVTRAALLCNVSILVHSAHAVTPNISTIS